MKRRELQQAVQRSWSEATTGPKRVMKEELEGDVSEFRKKLLTAQAQCPELAPLIAAAKHLLRASTKDKTKENEKMTKD